MATIRYIDKEEYAAKALELLNERREGYVDYALGLLKENLSPGTAGERLGENVRSEMENALFNYLKRSGRISGDYRYRYNHVTNCYRPVRTEPQKRDVPSDLLDLREILPNYDSVIGDIMAEAEKRWIIHRIEVIAKEAEENSA